MTSPQFNSSPGSVNTPNDTKELFQELLKRLSECHDCTVRGLQLKVNKLKKERYLDAQRLEEFYNRNQHLREEQKNLQESIILLKDRLKSGPCDHCKETEMKKTQGLTENQNNLSPINGIKAERDILREENRKLSLELKRLRSQQTSFIEPDEGMIPDSPLQLLSFPVVSKMKRKRDQSHVRYAEKLFSQPPSDLHKRKPPRTSGSHRGAVLVPETCDLDVTCFTNNLKSHGRTVVAETCHLDLCTEQKHPKAAEIPVPSCLQDSGSDGGSRTTLHDVPEQAQGEEHGSRTSPSTRKNVSVHVSKGHDSLSVERRISPSGVRQSLLELAMKKSSYRRSTKLVEHSYIHEPYDGKIWEPEEDRPGVSPPCSPVSLHYSWSVDPGAALSQYGEYSPSRSEPKAQPTGTMDMDCTYVSHSLLLRSRRRPGLDTFHTTTGIGLKANDSLANMFDTTGVGEYESCPQDKSAQEHVDVNEPEDVEQDEEEDEDEEQMMKDVDCMEGDFHRPSTQAGEGSSGDISEKSRPVACVEVVRTKNKRRKLQGHTCKECETYYADLPVSERQKKLSSCSRHRFRYIPPATPENFWEVGFPSTQTCVERGYIKEDNKVDPRMRRRRPYLAMFSPKAKAS